MAEKRERRSSSKEEEVSECGNQGEVHGKRVKRRMKGDTKKLGAIASPLVKVVMKEEEDVVNRHKVYVTKPIRECLERTGKPPIGRKLNIC